MVFRAIRAAGRRVTLKEFLIVLVLVLIVISVLKSHHSLI